MSDTEKAKREIRNKLLSKYSGKLIRLSRARSRCISCSKKNRTY